ncbi:hypothetical protein [Anabaena sp. UHCC 0204]|uniref:hypothetical protein n=1 Tax=Anabaena sp. UHCC 0204 TaxID=2590009 RepID=UPI00144733AC|nr:hypothetical protein [Anabaena sp. UHCC 0204]MTJ06844.1 hypothetical protein [Anabaena sp. UHCC 0204]
MYLFTLSHLTITRDYWGDRSLKSLPCICLHYLTQPLLGITRAIAHENPKTLPCICLRYLTQPLLGMFRAIV